MLGDLDEEHRARLARGGGRLTAFAWYTAEYAEDHGSRFTWTTDSVQHDIGVSIVPAPPGKQVP